MLDEFDRLTSEVERVRFADFLKQVGDKKIPVRFVLYQKLLGAFEIIETAIESETPPICE